MTFQSFVFLALLFFHSGVGATTIRSPSRHAHIFKRSTLKNNGSGPCMSAASNSDGAAVVVGACSTSWTLPASGSGQIHIFGNKCLDVINGQNQNGQKLQIWTCTGGPNQKFVLTNGQIQWKGTDKCIDLTNGSNAAGTPLQIWQCASGNTNQIWSYPASSSPAPAPSPPSNPPGPPSSSHDIFPTKLGLAYPDGNLSELLGLSAAKVFYNWTPKQGSLTASVNNGVMFLPMLWGWNQQAEFDQVAKTSNAPLFLGMNECNERGQSNMSPQSGIQLWRQSMKPVRDRGKLVCSPAMSGNPNGLTWMKAFSSQCGSDCDFDFLCIHWYDTTFTKFQNWLLQWHALYPNVKIIVTEFAPQNFNSGPQPNSGQVWGFYQQAIPWLMQTEWIAAFFPYGYMKDLNINQNSRLMNWDGSPNDLGNWIIQNST